MSVAEAVSLWKQHMEPYAVKVKLISPAVTGSPAGLQWLGDFLSQCTGCHISEVAVHWYDSATVSQRCGVSAGIAPVTRLVTFLPTERTVVQTLPTASS
jgi:hypothetical protein